MFSGDLFHQQLFQRSLGQDASPTPNTMDPYYTTTAFNNNIAFNWDEATAMESADMSFEMARTPSTNSAQRYDYPPALHFSASNGSASSSTVGSPFSGHAHMAPAQEVYQFAPLPFTNTPAIVGCDDGYNMDFPRVQDLFTEQDHKIPASYPGSVDPNLLSSSTDSAYTVTQHPIDNTQSYPQTTYTWQTGSTAPSPVPSYHSYSASHHNLSTELYEQPSRQQRGSSTSSYRSVTPKRSVSGDEDGSDKSRCTFPECGRTGIKDMKSHMVTHQLERPQKCTIPNCQYNKRGFARKYDKNRHVLTHYKGTMVCGFCPGSGTPAEKSFNRADVFKRHLTTMHNVEQNAPNSKKRNPTNINKKPATYCQDATGKCSTCSATFSNAQEFYEHLEDCILAIVQKVEESEGINVHNLSSMASDAGVQETFARHHIEKKHLPENQKFELKSEGEDEEEDEEDDDFDEEDDADDRSASFGVKSSKQFTHRSIIGGNITKTKSNRRGMTWSKIGVPLTKKGRKKRKDYPPSWGMAADKMKMKKRVLCGYEGPNRLFKDDMMLNNELEVRVCIGGGDSWVTDLDVETVKRANGYHSTDKKDRPWIPEQDFSFMDLMS